MLSALERPGDKMKTIEPIGKRQQNEVVSATAKYIEQAQSLFSTDFKQIPIYFDLKGKAAGVYMAKKNEPAIRYNPYLFAKYFDDNLAVTVPHEVAHYIIDRVYDLRTIRPHGREWKALMLIFGADASRTCNYNLEGIPQRVFQRYPYHCDCTRHELTARRHKLFQTGKMQYFCRQCGSQMVPAKQVN